MKKQLLIIAFSLFILTMLVSTVFGQQKEKKDNKKEQHKQGKQEDKQDKDKKDKKDDKDDKKNGNNNEGKGNNGKGNNGKNEGDNGNGNKNDHMKDGYSWNRETFKERNKYKNQDKVTICHKFSGGNEPAVTIHVSSNALKAHMNHGDVMGDCPAVLNKRYSNGFLDKRTEYYNILQSSQEQVVYSRSILDYALERLTNSRMQLITLQNNNVPAAEIERKQVVVVQLEQNVSLLQTLVGAAANLLVNKLK